MTDSKYSELMALELYLFGVLPHWITVVNVPITEGYQDWHVTPHAHPPTDMLSGEALPVTSKTRIKINKYTIGDETIYAGYSNEAKTLVIGKVEATE